MSKKDKTRETGGFDSVEHTLSKAERFIEARQKQLSIIVTVILAAVAIYLGVKKWYLAPTQKQALADIYMVEDYFARDSFNLVLDGYQRYADVEDIIDEYKFVKTVNLAHYYAGISLLRTGDFEGAIEHLEKFKTKSILLGAIKYGAIGDAYVELAELEKGIDFYLKAARRNPNNITTPLYLMKAGQVYEELNEYDEALELYQEIKDEYPDSREYSDIDKYIARATLLSE